MRIVVSALSRAFEVTGSADNYEVVIGPAILSLLQNLNKIVASAISSAYNLSVLSVMWGPHAEEMM